MTVRGTEIKLYLLGSRVNTMAVVLRQLCYMSLHRSVARILLAAKC